MPESPEEMRDRLAAGKTLRMVAEERARKFDGGDESRVQALMAENERLRRAITEALETWGLDAMIKLADALDA